MTEEKVNELFWEIIADTDVWEREGKEAEKILTYIGGAFDMAYSLKEAIRKSEVDG